MYKTLKLKSTKTNPDWNGITAHDARASVSDKIGEKTNIHIFEEYGIIVSLANNFNASANGCNKPKKPTILGPRRRCIAAMTFRSNNVKNATEINTGNITHNVFKITSITHSQSIAD